MSKSSLHHNGNWKKWRSELSKDEAAKVLVFRCGAVRTRSKQECPLFSGEREPPRSMCAQPSGVNARRSPAFTV